jgi:hypothetical protein
MTVFYTIKYDGRYPYALILSSAYVNGTIKPTELRGRENAQEYRQAVIEQYGEDVQMLPPSKFQQEVAKRQIHSPAIIVLLKRDGDLDLSHHLVYGSCYRPMSSMWARIDDAVFIR